MDNYEARYKKILGKLREKNILIRQLREDIELLKDPDHNKVLNPLTNRYVIRNGRTHKSLLYNGHL